MRTSGTEPHPSAATLSSVLVSKSLASCRSRSWLAGSPKMRFTIRRAAPPVARQSHRSSAARSCNRPLKELAGLVNQTLGERAVPGPDRMSAMVYCVSARYRFRPGAGPARPSAASPPWRNGRWRIQSWSAHTHRSGRSRRQGKVPSHLPHQPRQTLRPSAGSTGRKAPNFSAKWINIAPDSKTRMGSGRCGPPAPESWSSDLRPRNRTELIASRNVDEARRRTPPPRDPCQQFLQHHRHLHAVGRGQ